MIEEIKNRQRQIVRGWDRRERQRVESSRERDREKRKNWGWFSSLEEEKCVRDRKIEVTEKKKREKEP